MLLFLAALTWRLAYLARLSHTSLAESLSADAAIYWSWADHLRQHGWLGSRPFFLGPLYPYLLALIRFFLGDSVGRLLILQAVWGSAAVVLLADATRRVAGRLSGCLVGVVLCFYEMAVFFDGLVLAESFLFFLEALFLWWVAAQDWKAARPVAFAGLGALIGLLAEGRATNALLLLPVGLVLVRGVGATAWPKRAVAVLAGFAVVTAPVAVRNAVVAHEWIPFTYNLGYNLYAGNNPEATGTYTPIAGANVGAPYNSQDGGGEIDGRAYLRLTEGVTLGPGASSRYWADKAAAEVRARPARALGLALSKLGMFWNSLEYAQVESVHEFRAAAGPLGLPLVGAFPLLGSLALVGLWFALRRGPAAHLAIGYLVVMSTAVMPFFVTDRYRIHLIPGAALLAGVAIDRITQALRARDSRALVRLAGLLLVAIVIVNLPAPRLKRSASAWLAERNRGDRLLNDGRLDLATRHFERAIAIERSSSIDLGGRTSTRTAKAELHSRYASALQRLGRGREALPWLALASREAPDHPFIARALADAEASLGNGRSADSLYARLDSLPGGAGLRLASRGWQAARTGRLPEAERLFRASLEQAPRFPEAWSALIRLQVQLGKLPEATASLRQAKGAGFPQASIHAHAALLEAANGNPLGAEGELALVPASSLTDPTLADVVRVTRGLIGGPP